MAEEQCVDDEYTCRLLALIAEPFRGYARHIWKDLDFGLCRSKVDFDKLKSSGSNKNDLADQFTLVLPYGGSYLRWEVLFDSLYPRFAPDFKFDDETFLMNANHDFIEKHVPSLAQWNDADPKALSGVITELIRLYREHQKQLLCEDENSRPHFEYTALIGDCLTLENDVEILVGRGDAVNFMIKLNVDFSPLPGLYTDQSDENPGGECAVILVKYPNPTSAKLILSPYAAKLIGDISLPLMERTGVLMDYVPMVTELINKKIKFINELYRTALTDLIVKFENSVLEYDTREASFLFDVDDFYWITKINTNAESCDKYAVTLIPVHPMLSTHKTVSSSFLVDMEEFIIEQIKLYKKECNAKLLELFYNNDNDANSNRKRDKRRIRQKRSLYE